MHQPPVFGHFPKLCGVTQTRQILGQIAVFKYVDAGFRQAVGKMHQIFVAASYSKFPSGETRTLVIIGRLPEAAAIRSLMTSPS